MKKQDATVGGEWVGKDRESFSAWYRAKYALNKAEKDSAGLAQWTKPVKPREAA